jgi:hypothetical protein
MPNNFYYVSFLVIILFYLLIKKKELFTNKNKDMAILIHTFDGYSRYWDALLYFTNKYLDTDYDIYIGVENLDIPKETLGKVKLLKSGKGSFVKRLNSHLEILEKKGYKYIYLMQEDHWYTHKSTVGGSYNNIFKKSLELMEKDNIDCLKLHYISVYPFNIQQANKYGKLFGKDLYYMNNGNIPISHNGCIITMELLKHSCLVSKKINYSTAKGHESATFRKEFGTIKNSENSKGRWKIIQTEKKNHILYFQHVGYGGKLNHHGINALKKENKHYMIKKINNKQNQIRKRQENK